MADYQDIRGLRVKYLSADPTVTVGGEVWYNSTTGTLKSRLLSQAWISAQSYTTGRTTFGSAGTQSANVIWAGRIPAVQNITEEYNGSGWSNSGVIGTAGNAAAGFGTQTAAVSAGIFNAGMQTNVYQYDGSTWTAGTGIPAGRAAMGAAGILTAGVVFGGSAGPGFVNTSDTTNKYDGTSWTAGNAMTTGRTYTRGFGTQTAAVGCGGYSGSPNNDTTVDATEEYDGSTWTAGGAMNTARRGHSVSGILTAGLAFGGTKSPNTPVNVTESYDGTSWTTSPATLATVNWLGGGSPAGTSIAALNTEGGTTPYAAASVEEFNSSTEAFTPGAWAAGNNMNTARRGICSAKNAAQDAALGALGYVPPNPPGGEGTAHAETYDGSTWTNITSVPTGRYFGGGFGTQTTAVIIGGYSTVPTASQKDITNEWNGSSWSLGGAMPGGRANFLADGCGTETAGLAAGGPPATFSSTIEYDGNTWTVAPGTVNTSRSAGASFGVQSAAIAATGSDATPPGVSLASESYNGTAWTATNPTIYGGYGAGGAGTQTAGLIAGGAAPTNAITSQTWDGTNWSTNPSYTTSRSEQGGTGTQTSALIFAGSTTGPTVVTNATEEFTGTTSAANIVTLTTS